MKDEKEEEKPKEENKTEKEDKKEEETKRKEKRWVKFQKLETSFQKKNFV